MDVVNVTDYETEPVVVERIGSEGTRGRPVRYRDERGTPVRGSRSQVAPISSRGSRS